MSLIKALQESYIGGAWREEEVNDDPIRLHKLRVYHIPSGYRLHRVVEAVIDALPEECILEEQDWTFPYLTDLLAASKQAGFFEEINPDHSDWAGYCVFTDDEIVGYEAWNTEPLPFTYWCRTCMPPRKEDVSGMSLLTKERAATEGYICQACGRLLADPSTIVNWELTQQAVQIAWKWSGQEWFPVEFFPLGTRVPGTCAWKIILLKEKTKRVMVIAWEGFFIIGPMREVEAHRFSNDRYDTYDLGYDAVSWESRVLRSLFL